MDALPLIKCPCFRERKQTEKYWYSPYWNCFFDEILGSTGFELPKTVQVRDPFLGTVKLTLMVLTFLFYVVFYGLYVTKGYLKHEDIEGVMRMQLQHPVKGHCSPLHNEGCPSNYKSFDQLAYCSQDVANASGMPARHRLACQHLDEYDLDMGAFQAHQVLIPTRVSFIEQQQLCDSAVDTCANRYQNQKDVSRFIGDIERFTLLVDHSFVVDGVGGEMGSGMAAWNMQGFIRPCGPPFDCSVLPLEVLSNFSAGHPIDETTRRKLWSFWHAGEPPSCEEAYSTPFGDVMRIDYLLRILNISLDDASDLNFENHTTRQEGLSIMLEVIYKNYVSRSWPNALPVVYEYRFTLAPFETFKATSVFQVPGEPQRYIHDVHGLYMHARQLGKVGAFSLHHFFLMILEASLLFSVVRWFITCWSMNRRYKLEDKLCDVVQFDDEKGNQAVRETASLLGHGTASASASEA